MSVAVAGLTKRYGAVTALEDFSLTIPSGQLVALLGPSGAGKTTLLRSMAGLERPDSGTIAIDGVDITDLPVSERHLGFVFQHFAVISDWTVAENVAMGLEALRWPQPEIDQRVKELLDVVQLSDLGGRMPTDLSGGQRQRLGLARALAPSPAVLLMDEPFGSVDAKVREDLRAWLRDLHRSHPITTLFVTHDQSEALLLADRVVVMRDGRIEQDGHPEELYDNPANEFVYSFLGRTTRFDGHVMRTHEIRLVASETPGGLRGTVEWMRTIGPEVHLDVRVGDAAVRVLAHRSELPGERILVGDTVWLLPRA